LAVAYEAKHQDLKAIEAGKKYLEPRVTTIGGILAGCRRKDLGLGDPD
jgi:hypothetical protein